MVEATKNHAANKQSIMQCPYMPRPTKFKGKKLLIPEASTALPPPINSLDQSDSSSDQKQASMKHAVDRVVKEAVNAFASTFDKRLTKLTKEIQQKSDQRSPNGTNNGRDNKGFISFKTVKYIDKADLEIHKQQMDPGHP